MGISFKFLIVYFGEMDSKLSNTYCWLQLSDKIHSSLQEAPRDNMCVKLPYNKQVGDCFNLYQDKTKFLLND